MNKTPVNQTTEQFEGRNIVVCCDGTSNQFSEDRTNVSKLCRILSKDRYRQIVYYHPGVGTKAPPGFVTGLGAKIAKLAGLIFGYGLKRDIVDAYVFIMTHFRPGDRLFVFGFSRGAYTARALVALIKMYGLLMPGNDPMVPYLVDMFWAIDKEGENTDRRAAYFQLAADFRAELATADCRPHFVGVWDTVSSVGWIGSPTSLPYTHNNPDIAVLRHAVALDERRAFFRTNLVATPEGQDVRQIWFAGAHADVGGGYKEAESGLSRIALQWMLDQAAEHGLLIDAAAEADLLRQVALDAEKNDLPIHDSLTWKWWFAELVPKRRYDISTGGKSWRLNLFGRRNPGANPVLHDSAWTLRGYELPTGARKASEVWSAAAAPQECRS
ncbi:DUF2235 domain-containing protein [Bosea sp. F3-2]|uniref:T6SS phospholipase effector Tle1-like catalytic domain-containing protein n=1 Tax=Bosea sp. F3-2 TaxID=2599640 RepID=UPI0011EF4DF7|nr:DUF2235 domain-containing protein [Bosea sp. F3-2]QEL22937.1 DUF2235 domain-containing protein [Bosea sp. F3-2]